eukprot:CAMPEP_0179484990 /NCGR_PEP_ID=MMETSP0799-20121207/61759_1 /TAXON_ID=46947 /ORGANISM="Geminigera cryophila, Strain CCMP2564" /LENGTH=113 /DNA_ID=CAMNT_0021299231 /DNA_START=214 /DNA_END=555 /DNA_ORIENTATION=-
MRETWLSSSEEELTKVKAAILSRRALWISSVKESFLTPVVMMLSHRSGFVFNMIHIELESGLLVSIVLQPFGLSYEMHGSVALASGFQVSPLWCTRCLSANGEYRMHEEEECA